MDEHRTQRVFRNILEAMTFPGKIIQLEKSESQMANLFSQTAVICQTLLDSEVTFSVLNDRESSQDIHAYTGSHAVHVREADFIVIPKEATDSFLEQVEWAKTGNLKDPQNSATIIYEVDSLFSGTHFELSGPGIKEEAFIYSTIPLDFIETRAKLNAEYPLGIDAIFIDKEGYILALPRTTRVLEVR